jgi:hypothetical protein
MGFLMSCKKEEKDLKKTIKDRNKICKEKGNVHLLCKNANTNISWKKTVLLNCLNVISIKGRQSKQKLKQNERKVKTIVTKHKK